VVCDSYEFEEDKTRDLGIIKVKPGFSTPYQRVLIGEHTLEGFMAGAGALRIVRDRVEPLGERFDCEIPGGAGYCVHPGDALQWSASPASALIAFEVCYPPYEDGRFEEVG
jgi:hypothetical protein